MTNYSSIFSNLKQEINEILLGADFELESAHSLDTLRWVKEIEPNADECMQIAALAHDIDRGISPKILRKPNETYDDYKVRHAKRSAQLISELMAKHGYTEKLIKKTRHLVENHEVGGDEETDLLKDADSISFFSCNIEWYFNYKNKDYKETKREISYKYDRATPRAKALIKTINIKNELLRDMCKEIFK